MRRIKDSIINASRLLSHLHEKGEINEDTFRSKKI